jgi:hypothetical protein
MTIAPKPNIDGTARKTAQFIRAAGKKAAAATPKNDRAVVMMNFDRLILEALDSLAQEMNLTRTALVTAAVMDKLRMLRDLAHGTLKGFQSGCRCEKCFEAVSQSTQPERKK